MSMQRPRGAAESGIEAAQRARAELYDTLGQLRDRLDYAQRIDDAVDRTRDRLSEAKRENPIGFTVGVAVAAVAVGAVVWGASRLVMRAFKS